MAERSEQRRSIYRQFCDPTPLSERTLPPDSLHDDALWEMAIIAWGLRDVLPSLDETEKSELCGKMVRAAQERIKLKQRMDYRLKEGNTPIWLIVEDLRDTAIIKSALDERGVLAARERKIAHQQSRLVFGQEESLLPIFALTQRALSDLITSLKQAPSGLPRQ